MKKFKVSIFAVIAIVMGIAASAFTAKESVVKSPNAGFFYQYNSSSTAQADIQNISLYARASQSCSGSDHVCGVLLPTDKPVGQQPVTSEFNAEKSCLLYTSPSPRDGLLSRMPSSA